MATAAPDSEIKVRVGKMIFTSRVQWVCGFLLVRWNSVPLLRQGHCSAGISSTSTGV